MDPEKIGKFICMLRKEKNLSQYQLADLIPITRQGVSKWERGVTTPDPQTLLKLSELFDVSINELLNGERLPKNTIEETTLSILDQSNKKTKKIKRITITSLIIITVLLLSFLSYYFINSYNTIKVYKVIGNNNQFTTLDGIFMTTKEKYYLKLGRLRYSDDIKINNIKMYYKNNNKKVLLVEDSDIDNLTVINHYGYRETLNKIINNLYVEIEYNETEKTTLKLRFKSDFINDKLFYIKMPKEIKVAEESEKVEPQEPKTEEVVKEDTKPTIEEIPETKEETPPPIKEEIKEEPKEEPKKEVLTTDQIINKIKETCTLDLDSYVCEYDDSNIILMYYENMNKIELYEGYDLVGTKFTQIDDYTCTIDNCKNEFDKVIKIYLFA